MSGNGYTTADELLSFCGKRLFVDEDIVSPFDGAILRFQLRSLTEEDWSGVSTGNYDTRSGGLSASGLQLSDARLIAVSLCDGRHNLMFTGRDAATRIASLPSFITQPLVRRCRDLNNLRQPEEDAGKNLPRESASGTNSLESQETPAQPEYSAA